MPFKLNAIALSMLLLSACGGGSSPRGGIDDVPDTPSDNASADSWKGIVFKRDKVVEGGAFQQVVRNGNDLYFANSLASNHNGFYLFKSSDLTHYKKFYFDKGPGLIVHVDDSGFIRMTGRYSNDGDHFIEKNTDLFQDRFGTTVSNGSTVLLQQDDKDFSPYISHDRGIIFERAFDYSNEEYPGKQVKGGIEFASNGLNSFFMVAVDKGIWFSDDLGKHWKQILANEGEFESVAANKHHSNTIFAAKRGALYRSLDAGNTWSKVNQPTYKGSNILLWSDMELLDDGTLIALVATENIGLSKAFFFESKDLGNSWTIVGKPIDPLSLKYEFGNIEGTDKFYLIQVQSTVFMYRERK